jgi:hypothetical protein
MSFARVISGDEQLYLETYSLGRACVVATAHPFPKLQYIFYHCHDDDDDDARKVLPMRVPKQVVRGRGNSGTSRSIETIQALVNGPRGTEYRFAPRHGL